MACISKINIKSVSMPFTFYMFQNNIITFLGLCLTLKKTHMNEDRTEIN
jgi:hypothetical protein